MTSPAERSETPTDVHGLVLDLAGGPLAVQVTASSSDDASALAAELRRLWSHVVIEPDADDEIESITVRRPLRQPGTDEDQDALCEAIERDTYAASGLVTRAVLPRLVGTRVLLHAGTVRREDSGTTTVIGPSGAGKSTAISTLGEGAVYLSDELTILDPETFTITGYPKPVSRASAAGHKRDVALSELGLTPARDAGAPDHILLLSRDPQRTAPAELTRCPMATAIVRITEQSSSMWLLPRPLETLARLLDSVGGALEARYSESRDLPALLREPPAALREEWTVLDPAPGSTSESADEESAPAAQRPAADAPVSLTETVAAAPFRQALFTQDGVVVLREMSILHLTGLNALVWEILAESGPLTGHDVARQLVATIGEHPEAEEFTRQALDHLQADALIRLR